MADPETYLKKQLGNYNFLVEIKCNFVKGLYRDT